MQSPGGSRKLQATADPALVKAQTVAEAVRQMQNVGVSSAATTVPWTGVTGTPTTLAGYGITNAAIGVGGVAVNATTAVTAGTVTTAAQPAITSVGTLTGLTVKGTVAIAGSSSGAVSFVAQSAAGSVTYVLPNADGINNDVLTTDGSGNLSWSVKAGGGGGTISTINGDGSAAQTIAAGAGLTIGNAGAVHTLALDLNYAPTYTTTITAAGFAGPLTGNADTATNVAWSGVTSTPTTLAGYGITDAYTKTAGDARYSPIAGSASIVTIGTLGAGAVPASLVTAGTFGAGNFAFPGNLTVGTDTGGTRVLALDAAASNVRDLRWQTAGVNRWIARADSAAESGANAGSNFDLIALDDSGAVIGNPLTINRATMAASFAGTLGVTNDFSVNGKFTVDHATGNTVVAGTVTATSATFTANSGSPDFITIGNATSGDAGGVKLLTGSTHYGWIFAAQFNVGGALEWTPSTAVGGTTFSTPVMTLTQAGVLTVTSTIGASNFSGSSSGTNTGDQTTISGNAGTATKLATARAINGVSFDGSMDITVTAEAATLTGTSLNPSVVTSALTSVGTLATLTVTATITGAVSGNAGTATTLATARAINGVNFDGSAPITVTAAAGTLTGTTLNATVVTSSLTTVGTLGALTVTGLTTTGGVAIPSAQLTVTGGAGITGPSGNGQAVVGALSTNGLILTGQGGFNDVTIQNSAGSQVITIPTGGTQVNVFGALVANSLRSTSTVQTGNPSGGTAAPWKMGSLITTLFSGALIPTQYVELDISGTLVKVATIT